jgi:hypothetical protein
MAEVKKKIKEINNKVKKKNDCSVKEQTIKKGLINKIVFWSLNMWEKEEKNITRVL